MTDHEFEARVQELKQNYIEMDTGDELAAHYTALSFIIGLQTPENHASELFLATAAKTWVSAYRVFSVRIAYLVCVQLLALAAGYYFHLSTPSMLLFAPALTFAFGVLAAVMGAIMGVGAKYLHNKRSLPIQQFIESVEERSQETLEQKVSDAKARRAKGD